MRVNLKLTLSITSHSDIQRAKEKSYSRIERICPLQASCCVCMFTSATKGKIQAHTALSQLK